MGRHWPDLNDELWRRLRASTGLSHGHTGTIGSAPEQDRSRRFSFERSTIVRTSPFRGLDRPETFNVRVLSAQLKSVYGGVTFESLCDASIDEFPAREPVDLLALRLSLACNGRLFQGNLVSLGHLRSLGRRGRECSAANEYHRENASK